MVRKLLLLIVTILTGCRADICNHHDTGFQNEDEQAIVCYAGTLLIKMLTKLNAGTAMGPTRMTQEHLRERLLPFLGGEAGIASLRSDTPRTGNCTVCYNDTEWADELVSLRNQVPADQLSRYDGLDVCYMLLNDRIMDLLPKNPTESSWYHFEVPTRRQWAPRSK